MRKRKEKKTGKNKAKEKRERGEEERKKGMQKVCSHIFSERESSFSLDL